MTTMTMMMMMIKLMLILTPLMMIGDVSRFVCAKFQ